MLESAPRRLSGGVFLLLTATAGLEPARRHQLAVCPPYRVGGGQAGPLIDSGRVVSDQAITGGSENREGRMPLWREVRVCEQPASRPGGSWIPIGWRAFYVCEQPADAGDLPSWGGRAPRSQPSGDGWPIFGVSFSLRCIRLILRRSRSDLLRLGCGFAPEPPRVAASRRRVTSPPGSAALVVARWSEASIEQRGSRESGHSLRPASASTSSASLCSSSAHSRSASSSPRFAAS